MLYLLRSFITLSILPILPILLSLPLLFFISTANAAEYYWMDGDRRITLRLYPGLVADVPGDKWKMHKIDAGQIRSSKLKSPTMVVYELKDKSLENTEFFLEQAAPGISPVFKKRGGGFQALPGGYIVIFDEDMNQDSIANFFDSENISKDRISKISWSDRGFQVSDIPGLPSLNAANRLANMQGVKSAYPDIWSTGYSTY